VHSRCQVWVIGTSKVSDHSTLLWWFRNKHKVILWQAIQKSQLHPLGAQPTNALVSRKYYSNHGMYLDPQFPESTVVFDIFLARDLGTNSNTKSVFPRTFSTSDPLDNHQDDGRWIVKKKPPDYSHNPFPFCV
jgi:hypothetical protein